MIAANMANMKSGPKKSDQHLHDVGQPVSIDDVAVELKVSSSSVDRAKRVIASGDKDLIEAVESGEMPVAVAARAVKAASAP
jgi:hypothetical protein